MTSMPFERAHARFFHYSIHTLLTMPTRTIARPRPFVYPKQDIDSGCKDA